METSVLEKLITAFASEPSTLLLAMVLFGLGYLAYKLLGSFVAHGEKLNATLDRISESLKEMTEDLKEVKVILFDRKPKE